MSLTGPVAWSDPDENSDQQMVWGSSPGALRVWGWWGWSRTSLNWTNASSFYEKQWMHIVFLGLRMCGYVCARGTYVCCGERVCTHADTVSIVVRFRSEGGRNLKAIHMHLSVLSSSLICCLLLCGTDCFNRWWRFYFVPGKGCNIVSQKPHYLYLWGGIQTSVIFMPLTKKVTDRYISQTLFCTFPVWSLWWHSCACEWSIGTHFTLISNDLAARREGGATVVMETTENRRELGS